MLIRLLAAWCLLLILAIGNGAFREAVLTPLAGPAHRFTWAEAAA